MRILNTHTEIEASVTDFILGVSWQDVPGDVQSMAIRCLVDLCATLAAGQKTELGMISRNVATAVYGGNDATLLFDGRKVSAAGAALANGMSIDAMDMHDGYRPAKGHAGVNVIPAALAMGEKVNWTGEAFLGALVVGYEVALRAAVVLHRTACDYHTSGAWGALGAAAVVARALNLSPEQTRHALGIAEYHGPRSQMMRCIDHPTMLKDGSGWGSMSGVLAGLLAAEGFTGAPALTVESDVEEWASLGDEWLMRDLYFKPYAVCRWAQPTVEAARQVSDAHRLQPETISRIDVYTFAAATHLATSRPRNTEEAQYSLPYPVAAALIDGKLDPEQVTPPRIYDEAILSLADRVAMHVDDTLEARFPNEALARVVIHTQDGQALESAIHSASGDPHNPLSDAAIEDKFFRLVSPVLGQEQAAALFDACHTCALRPSIHSFVRLLA